MYQREIQVKGHGRALTAVQQKDIGFPKCLATGRNRILFINANGEQIGGTKIGGDEWTKGVVQNGMGAYAITQATEPRGNGFVREHFYVRDMKVDGKVRNTDPHLIRSYSHNNSPGKIIVGNLFAATTNPSGFQNEEIELLQAFGQQAAAGIFNAQLYREIDEQRQVAQVFGTMAFSASKSIHQFRNDIGFIRGSLQLLPYIEKFTIFLQHVVVNGEKKDCGSVFLGGK